MILLLLTLTNPNPNPNPNPIIFSTKLLGMQDSRFFITLNSDSKWADEKYSAFGRVTKGMSLISGLATIKVQPPANFPQTPVRIVNAGVY